MTVVRTKILQKQYAKEFGRGNAHFPEFLRAIRLVGAHYMEMPRYYSGRDRDQLAACYLFTAGGMICATISPGGRVDLCGADGRVLPRWEDRYPGMAPDPLTAPRAPARTRPGP
jgi:hypothetical protein